MPNNNIVGDLKVNKMPGQLFITVRFGRELRFRVWLGSQIIRLAGWVMHGIAPDVDYGEIRVHQA